MIAVQVLALLSLLCSSLAAPEDWTSGVGNGNTTINQAIDYALAYVQIGRHRITALGTDDKPGRVPLNDGFDHARQLANASWRDVTTPNSDTLFSMAYVDLSHGPINITMPDMNGRYYSVAFMDMATNNVQVGGHRMTGTLQNTWVVVGPQWKDALPIASRVVQSPGND